MYLNCHSYYSLRYGTMSVEQLVQKALDAGADTLSSLISITQQEYLNLQANAVKTISGPLQVLNSEMIMSFSISELPATTKDYRS